MTKQEVLFITDYLTERLDVVKSKLLEIRSLANDDYDEHQDACAELLDSICCEIESIPENCDRLFSEQMGDV